MGTEKKIKAKKTLQHCWLVGRLEGKTETDIFYRGFELVCRDCHLTLTADSTMDGEFRKNLLGVCPEGKEV